LPDIAIVLISIIIVRFASIKTYRFMEVVQNSSDALFISFLAKLLKLDNFSVKILIKDLIA